MFMDAKFRRIIRVLKKYTDICGNRGLRAVGGGFPSEILLGKYKKSNKLFHGGSTEWIGGEGGCQKHKNSIICSFRAFIFFGGGSSEHFLHFASLKV